MDVFAEDYATESTAREDGDLLRRRMSLFVFVFLCLAVPCMVIIPYFARKYGDLCLSAPTLSPPVAVFRWDPDGILGAETRKAVQAFQRTAVSIPTALWGTDLAVVGNTDTGKRRWRDEVRHPTGRHPLDHRPSVLRGMNVLARVNNIKDPSLIRPGQELSIPETDTRRRGGTYTMVRDR